MTYLITIRDRVLAFCTACGGRRFIYVQVEQNEQLTCCCVCSRILKREPA